jgi:hypothetical protein
MSFPKLVFLGIVILLLTFEGLSIAHAQTLTNDFGTTNLTMDNSGHNILCTINVSTSIQTEPNGKWIANNTYEVNWTISITYLNQSLYDPNNFWIICNNPENIIQNAVGQNVTTPQTTATPHMKGELIMIFKPSIPANFTLDSSFSFAVFYKGNKVTSGSWEQNATYQPININVVNNQVSPSPTIPEFSLVGAISLLAVASVSLVYLRKKKGKP